MRIPLPFLAALSLAACATPKPALRPEVPPPPVKASHFPASDYRGPFGSAPARLDLRAIFLSLPDPLAGDMPKNIRLLFIDSASTDTVNHLFDEKAGYLTYFSDNPFSKIQASCRFTIKVLPSRRYPYVVAIHLAKWDLPPSAANTFFLAPSGGQWIDVTSQVLPSQTPRDWYFAPAVSRDAFEAGSYEKAADGSWGPGPRKYDLIWAHDRLRARPAASSRFTF